MHVRGRLDVVRIWHQVRETVLEIAGAVSGPIPAPRPRPFVRVVVVVIGVVVGVLVGVVGVVAHHAIHAAGRPQVTERRALSRRGLVGVAGPGRRVASLEPVAGGGSGSAGAPRRACGPLPRCRRAVAEQQDRRARLRGCGVGSARGGGARVPSALRLVLRAQAQQAEHLPVVLPLDPLAPGGRSRGRLARGLLLAGCRRGAAQERAELQRPEQKRGPGEAHRSRRLTAPTPGGRRSEKRETGPESREGGEKSSTREAGNSVPTSNAKGGLRTLAQQRRLLGRGTRLSPLSQSSWKAAGSGAAAPASGQRLE